jgi:hypothetical protein
MGFGSETNGKEEDLLLNLIARKKNIKYLNVDPFASKKKKLNFFVFY